MMRRTSTRRAAANSASSSSTTFVVIAAGWTVGRHGTAMEAAARLAKEHEGSERLLQLEPLAGYWSCCSILNRSIVVEMCARRCCLADELPMKWEETACSLSLRVCVRFVCGAACGGRARAAFHEVHVGDGVAICVREWCGASRAAQRAQHGACGEHTPHTQNNPQAQPPASERNVLQNSMCRYET